MVPLLLALLSLAAAQGPGSQGELGACLLACADTATSGLAGNFTLSDVDGGEDYDTAPAEVMQTRKTCRVLQASEDCGGECLYRLGGAKEESHRSGNASRDFFDALCGEGERGWRDALQSCFFKTNTGTGYLPACSAQCGFDGYAAIVRVLRKAMKRVAQTGSRGLLRPALDRACSMFACITPCQADFYKRSCGQAPANLLLKGLHGLARKLETQLRAWDSIYWPPACAHLAHAPLILPSEVVTTTYRPFFNPLQLGDQHVWRTEGLAELMSKLKPRSAASKSSQGFLLIASSLLLGLQRLL